MATITASFLGAAHIHTPGFVEQLKPLREAGEVAVKYVWDRDAARAASTAEKLGAETAASVDAVLGDPQVSAVVVLTETAFHPDIVLKAAAAGKNLFVEKPLAISSADATRMADAIEKAGVVFQTGFFSRGQSVHQFIKREVKAGHLGKLTRARYSNCHGGASLGWFDKEWAWFAQPELSGGGALLDLGAHPLDLIINTYSGEGEIVGVYGALTNITGKFDGKVDEFGSGLLVFESGFEAAFDASWVDKTKLHSPLSVTGTQGAILVLPDGVYYQSELVDGADGSKPIPADDLPKGAPHAFRLFWERLLGRDLPIPLVSVREASLGATVMEKIYKNASR